MLRQTTITVVEKVRPRKEMIKKRVRVEKAIALGINLGITALSFVLIVSGCITAFVVACNGLVLIDSKYFALPAIAIAFMWGHGSGYIRCKKKHGGIYDEWQQIM